MVPVTPTLASVFRRKGAEASWSKLEEDHWLSQLCSKYWGKVIEHDAKQWRKSHPSVKVNRTVEIGPKCFGVDLGIDLKCSMIIFFCFYHHVLPRAHPPPLPRRTPI